MLLSNIRRQLNVETSELKRVQSGPSLTRGTRKGLSENSVKDPTECLVHSQVSRVLRIQRPFPDTVDKKGIISIKKM